VLDSIINTAKDASFCSFQGMKIMFKMWLLPLIVAFAQTGPSWAQQYPQAVTASASQETIDEVVAKTNDINKKSLPEKEVVLNHELESIDIEMTNTSAQKKISLVTMIKI
jgi:hypothetical protein